MGWLLSGVNELDVPADVPAADGVLLDEWEESSDDMVEYCTAKRVLKYGTDEREKELVSLPLGYFYSFRNKDYEPECRLENKMRLRNTQTHTDCTRMM
jgi:hypothetical protein